MTDLKSVHKKAQNFSEKSSQKFAEVAFIFIFVVFGIIGLYLILDNMTFRKNTISGTSIYKVSVDDNRSEDTKALAVAIKEPANSEEILEKQLHVTGPREALTPVIFEVENFNQNAEYLLDFGDGLRRVLNQRTDSHIYKKAGNYDLALYVTYQGNRRMLTSKSIKIMEPITVATNATRIDF